MKNPKVLFVTTHFTPDYHYGGVVESGSKLLKYLRKTSDNIQLICVSKTPVKSRKFIENNDIVCKSVFFHDWGFSLSLFWKLFRAVNNADVVFINGIVTFPTTLAQFYSILLGKPFINSIRGGLENWRVNHKSWKKKPYLTIITLPLLKQARYIHVTAEEEQMTLTDLGFNNTFIASNGIDLDVFEILPQKKSYVDEKGIEKFLFLFLSRTDKEKGIDILLQAYKRICQKYDNHKFHLMIVGPDNQGYLKSFDIDFTSNNISYNTGIYNDEKIKLLRQTNAFVLPSYSENFGNVIAEALACEVPVITTTGTPWREITDVGCGIYIEPNVDELYEALESIFLMPEQKRNAMGKKGRAYLLANFSWKDKAMIVKEKLDSI
jgi:glycosyltransferase involved in cell wall biosynthesis